MAAGGNVAPSNGRSRLVERLDHEWRALVDASAATVAAWAGEQPALAGCADLDDVLRATRVDGDGVLLALLTRSRDGDPLAARTVLQAMLGKMVLMALRTPGASVEDFVAELWPVIATYPVGRRPHRIAANLALDTLKQVKGGPTAADLSWELLPELVQASVLARSDIDARRLGAEQVLARALELELIDPPTVRALSAVYLEGLTSAQAGASVGSSAEMVRYRCSRALRRLAGEAVTLAAA